MVIKYIILTILLSQLSISCLTNTEIDNDVEVKKEVPVKIVTKEENNKGDLVIYSGRKESLIGPLINQFKYDYYTIPEISLDRLPQCRSHS